MQFGSQCTRVLQPTRYLAALISRPLGAGAASITNASGQPEGYQPVDDIDVRSSDPGFIGTPEDEGTADPATTANTRPTAAAQREKQHEVQGDSRPGGPADASRDTAGIMREAPGMPASGSHTPFTGTNREPYEEQKHSGKSTKV